MPHLLQVAVSDTSFRDFFQYIADAAALGAFGFAWRTNTRVTRLETILSEPEMGVIPSVSHLRKSSHGVNNQLHEHGARLDGHDVAIGEIRDERRQTTRRATDRERDE